MTSERLVRPQQTSSRGPTKPRTAGDLTWTQINTAGNQPEQTGGRRGARPEPAAPRIMPGCWTGGRRGSTMAAPSP